MPTLLVFPHQPFPPVLVFHVGPIAGDLPAAPAQATRALLAELDGLHTTEAQIAIAALQAQELYFASAPYEPTSLQSRFFSESFVHAGLARRDEKTFEYGSTLPVSGFINAAEAGHHE